jgi:hypothetical protein
LISTESVTPPKLDYLSVGDPLPDGKILIGITAESAVVKDERDTTGQRIYKLFDRKP